MNPQELAERIAAVLDEKKAIDIEILDVHEMTTIADYFVIASGRSALQVSTLADEIEEKLGQEGYVPLRRDGRAGGRWIVHDYGSVIVHIFHQEEREFYNLERLWNNGLNARGYAPQE